MDLEVSIGVDDVGNRGEQIKDLIRKNPQIRSIRCHYFPIDYLKDINELLPQLEKLSVYDFDLKNEMVHFENVKQLVSQHKRPFSINQLVFARLDTIDMVYADEVFGTWMEFFGHHQNVTKLILRCNSADARLVELVGALPNLHEIELKLENDCSIMANTIIQIVQNHDQLMKFTFPMDEHSEPEIEKIQKQLANEWILEEIDDGIILLLHETETDL